MCRTEKNGVPNPAFRFHSTDHFRLCQQQLFAYCNPFVTPPAIFSPTTSSTFFSLIFASFFVFATMCLSYSTTYSIFRFYNHCYPPHCFSSTILVYLPNCCVQPAFIQPNFATLFALFFPQPLSLLATNLCLNQQPIPLTLRFLFTTKRIYSQIFLSFAHSTAFLPYFPPPPLFFVGSDVLSADCPSWRGAM